MLPRSGPLLGACAAARIADFAPRPAATTTAPCGTRFGGLDRSGVAGSKPPAGRGAVGAAAGFDDDVDAIFARGFDAGAACAMPLRPAGCAAFAAFAVFSGVPVDGTR